MTLAALALDPATEALLTRYGFDAETFAALRARLASGADTTAANALTGTVAPPGAEHLYALPEPGTVAHAELTTRGERAIAAGEVGVVILAGGMATRFGGGVKAAVDVFPGRSFLSLKLADVEEVAGRLGGRVPVYLLASFATHEVVERLGRAASQPRTPVETVSQFVSLRLRPDGEIFREADGRPSPYAPGHGDLTFALRASGALSRFRQGGGKILFVSNVDNLAATLDPAVLGAHLARGRAVTVESVRCEPGDVGGAPALVDGVLQIVEAFRFPAAFDQSRLPVFNTNTFVFDAAAIDRGFDLSWFYVRKKVAGQEVIQFERLVGEVTSFIPTGLLVVPRHPPTGRFQPVKDPAELDRRREDIRLSLSRRGLLSQRAA